MKEIEWKTKERRTKGLKQGMIEMREEFLTHGLLQALVAQKLHFVCFWKLTTEERRKDRIERKGNRFKEEEMRIKNFTWFLLYQSA